MPSKEVLKTEILAIATELSVEVKLEDLSHEQLTSLLSDLRAKKRDAENATQADEPEQEQADEPEPEQEPTFKPEPEAPKPFRAVISLTGKNATSISVDDVVTPKMLEGGERTFEKLKEKGFIKQ